MPYWLHEPQPCLLAEGSGCNAGLQTAQAGVKAAWVFAEVVQVGMFCFDLGLVFVVTLVYLNLLFYSCSFFVTKEILEGKFYFLFGRKICLASLAQLIQPKKTHAAEKIFNAVRRKQ